MIQSNRQQAWQLIRLQCYFVVLGAVIALFWGGVWGGTSLLLGGLTAVLPTVYFAHTFFAKTGVQAAKQITRMFYRAEAVKLLSTGVLFIVMIECFSPSFLHFFMGFAVAQLAFWIGPLYIRPESKTVVES